jgi:hypothetical protein
MAIPGWCTPANLYHIEYSANPTKDLSAGFLAGIMIKLPTSVEYSSLDETEPLVFNMGASYFSKRVLPTVDCSLWMDLGAVTLNPFLQASASICALAVAIEVAGDQKAC